jgi:hypothetical protein
MDRGTKGISKFFRDVYTIFEVFDMVSKKWIVVKDLIAYHNIEYNDDCEYIVGDKTIDVEGWYKNDDSLFDEIVLKCRDDQKGLPKDASHVVGVGFAYGCDRRHFLLKDFLRIECDSKTLNEIKEDMKSIYRVLITNLQVYTHKLLLLKKVVRSFDERFFKDISPIIMKLMIPSVLYIDARICLCFG